MKICVSPQNIYINQTSPSFGRKLREDEKPHFEKTMNDAFEYLGINNRALIVHGSSFPSQVITDKTKTTPQYYTANVKGNNPFIGTPYLSKDFTDFVKMNGFNSIQLGPNGKLNKRDNSPYHASVFAKNSTNGTPSSVLYGNCLYVLVITSSSTSPTFPPFFLIFLLTLSQNTKL